MKKIDTVRLAEAYGPDKAHSLSLQYHATWTERQAAEDIALQFWQCYGEEPETVTVTTITKYKITSQQ